MVRITTSSRKLPVLRGALLVVGAAAAAVATMVPQARGATLRFDNTGGDGLWETGQNWLDGTDASRHVPTTADIADISNSYTASISTAHTVQELQVAHPDSTLSTSPGTATLNILPGTDLRISSTNGARIGRKVLAGSGQTPGSSTGRVIQTGGAFTILSGTNGLRLSQADGTTVADSLWRISGGSARGGLTDGSMTAHLAIGSTTNNYNRAEFHVNGSGATSIRFNDVQMGGSLTGVGNGDAVLHFSIDSGGVTRIIAEDEMQFRGNATTTGDNLLEIDLIGEAPEADIILIQADRLATNGGHTIETFTGMPNGTQIVRQFGNFEYTWDLLYTDASDNGVLDAFVTLGFVSKTEIPEPTTTALLALGGAMCAVRRRRR